MLLYFNVQKIKRLVILKQWKYRLEKETYFMF